jgi:hypothetical protein
MATSRTYAPLYGCSKTDYTAKKTDTQRGRKNDTPRYGNTALMPVFRLPISALEICEKRTPIVRVTVFVMK